MPEKMQNNVIANYAAHVFWAADLTVISGANLGDPLMAVDELCLGDVYMLDTDTEAHQLSVQDGAPGAAQKGRFLRKGTGHHTIAPGSDIGKVGDGVSLEGRISLMAPDGDKVDVLLVLVSPSGPAAPELFFLPLAPIEPKVSYTLLSAHEDPGHVRLTDITPVAFTRGTLITMGNGVQRPIEDLKIGDKILTRDRGPKQLRWIGRRTVRAIGPFAPVVIPKGTLSNASDMIVSQYQRIFIYQPAPKRLSERAEILVRARDLVDDQNVYVRSGGFVEYFHLVFDQHEIIYAECIPTESMLVDEQALGRMPEEMADEVTRRLPELSHRPHFGVEANKELLQRVGPSAFHRTPPARGRR